MANITLVDDDENIVASVSLALESHGHKITAYHDGASGLEALLASPPDLVILDVKMPRMDGMEVLRKLRQTSQIPVIMLTSKDEEIDEILGFNLGADDYIHKPFSQRLLLERVKALLRRVGIGTGESEAQGDAAARAIRRGKLTMDPARHESTWDGKPVKLTVTEFLLLQALAQRPGFVKSRDNLMDAAYDDQVYVDDRTIDSHVKRMRKKFRVVDPEFDAIETCTALATDTAKAEPDDTREARPRSRFRLVGSRLGALILALNLLSLLILFVGALALNEWRRGLIEARQESLMAQAELMSNVLGELGITTGVPTPALDEYETAVWLRDNFVPVGQRARVFDRDGLPVADSYMVTEAIPGAPLDPALPAGTPEAEPDLEAEVEEDHRLEQARLELATEIESALTEGPQAGVRRDESGNRVISVSLPIRHVRQELGVLTLEAADVDEILAAQRAALMPFAIVALVVSLFSSLLLHLFVARPVMRLSAAADSVRLQQTRAISMPDLEERRDEIGDLARSLETMTRALSDRMEAIERFAADVSHEIKNPLTSIRSALETLPLVKAEAQREKLTALLQQDVRRLDRLITDISNASRLDAELARDRPRTLDLAALLSDIVDVYQASPKPGDVPLHLSIETSGPTRIVGRDGPLGQVVRNLIDNARSFSPPDGSVRLILDRPDDGSHDLRIRVEDDGPGIPDENLETVFQRFYTSRPKGTQFGTNSGLGLSIVRQIIEAHGGRVWAENIIDPEDPARIAGARFVITLTPLPARP